MSEREIILELIERGHSTALRNEMISYIGNDKKRMAALMYFFFHENWVYNQRASWPVGIIGEKKPQLLKPYLTRLIKGLSTAKHDAVLRNTVRVFQKMDIPEELQGELYQQCVRLFTDYKQAIAVRAFSMSVLANIASPFPELRAEVLELIDTFNEGATAAYIVRAKKIRKAFLKDI